MNIPANDSALIPIFIFSLPRSGSTLLQRILGASREISTVAEPWILLPYIYTLKSDGIISEYWHSCAFGAIEDFYNEFPKKKKDYKEELRRFILNIYKKQLSPNTRYFLDKTPRYSLICDEIITLIPDAKFIFLWRNPLSIVSSILKRWCNGRWKIMIYNIDLYIGLNNLLNTFTANRTRSHSLTYESLIQNPEQEVTKICDYLEINYKDKMLHSFYNTPLNGRMTEKSGGSIYGNKLSKKSLDSWKTAFNNPYRQQWAKSYLRWIGDDRLRIMGYDYFELNAEIRSKKNFSINSLLKDLSFVVLMKSKIMLSPLKVHQKRDIKCLYM